MEMVKVNIRGHPSLSIVLVMFVGETVLFTQKVYAKFDKVTRHRGLTRKRNVAGKVIKESYGASKQQHTFIVRLFFYSTNHFLQSP
ncbi:hypothetical protein IC582_004781 [Cucumis melo]